LKPNGLVRSSPIFLWTTWTWAEKSNCISAWFIEARFFQVSGLMGRPDSLAQPSLDNSTCNVWNNMGRIVSGFKFVVVDKSHSLVLLCISTVFDRTSEIKYNKSNITYDFRRPFLIGRLRYTTTTTNCIIWMIDPNPLLWVRNFPILSKHIYGMRAFTYFEHNIFDETRIDNLSA
jgi:hypothetical protein